ncbi:MAG: DNA mismatch repair endonuclease MutL [Armatimonadota bacterium]
MSRIHVLSENVANRIAAGEVVERPASVVKELVENAIDAGATHIEVELEAGGKRLIRVTDDGVGMSREDLELAVQRFATSKITGPEDLHVISTMGFRGEALPSIGAVSRMQITTREREAPEAYRLIVMGGDVEEPKTVAAPSGTTVEVRNLFYNTPAREKFMATTATERAHCLDWCQRLALARPDIAFRVTHDGTRLLSTSGNGDLRAVIAAVYGSSEARLFLPVKLREDEVAVSGFISSPRLTRARRRDQIFFVNQRFVRSPSLSHAVTQAYGMLLPSGRHALAVLHFTLDAASVDPNVHPTKIEVRFGNAGRMHNFCQRAVEEALGEAGLRTVDRPAPKRDTDSPFRSQPRAGKIDIDHEKAHRKAARLRVNPFADSVDERDAGLDVFGEMPASGELQESQEALADLAGASANVIGHLAHKYLVVTVGDDLLLIDQHRAAERVLFHKMKTQQGAVAMQLLAVPITPDLSAQEIAAIENYREELKELGFTFESFGPEAYMVRSIPAALTGGKDEQMIRDLLRDLAEWDSPSSLERLQEKLRATVACHGAIKAGESLTGAEMQQLVNDLIQTDTPAVCPHGDPIIITLKGTDLDRKFKR